MELFADCREANVMHVARALGYPQSSTSALLQSLTAQGYLRHNARRRTYSAGARAGLIGSMLSARVFGTQDIVRLVERVAQATGRAAYVCDVIGQRVHYLIGSECHQRGPAHLTSSAAGLLYLATLPMDETRAELSDTLTRVRRARYAVWSDAVGTEFAISLGKHASLALVLSGARLGDENQIADLARRTREVPRQWGDLDPGERTLCST
jgi:DNA-binding IclR family transcriptional regulator